jgi:hypothetical protein
MIYDANQDFELTGCSHDEIAKLVTITTTKEPAIASKIKLVINFIIRLLIIYFYLEHHLSQGIIVSTTTIAVVPELSYDIQ